MLLRPPFRSRGRAWTHGLGTEMVRIGVDGIGTAKAASTLYCWPCSTARMVDWNPLSTFMPLATFSRALAAILTPEKFPAYNV